MRGDPILRQTIVPNPYDPDRGMVLTVEGGLHYLRGNSAPHFSLTYTTRVSGGAGHDTILELYPELEDLAALHLSNIDGAPMHAEANGWYWLAGALGGLGEQYHGGSGSNGKDEGECLATFARHCRISEAEARAIRSAVLRAYGTRINADDPEDQTDETGAEAVGAARAQWAAIMAEMRPRWKREAEAAIEKHGLVVYGDPWTCPTCGMGEAGITDIQPMTEHIAECRAIAEEEEVRA